MVIGKPFICFLQKQIHVHTQREQSGSYFEHKTFQSPQRTARMMSSESIKEHMKKKAGYTCPRLKSPGSKKVCPLAGPLTWLKFLIIPLP